MSRAHIANTFFEKELESPSNRPLSAWLRSHPVTAQLQFLPLLYAAPDDVILVTELPENPDPRLCLLDSPPPISHLETWGPSLAVAAWAKKHKIPYAIPDWPLVQKINSKLFSFENSPKLPHAKVLHSKEEADAWLSSFTGPKVLKTPFGSAGNGHIHCHLYPNVKQLYMPMIGEPWVERVADFSTQWKDGKLIAVTCFENTERGTYKGTFAGEVEPWALKEHLDVASPLVKSLGYDGHIGIDAFIYLWEGKKRVQPVVEINARKTMSWVSFQMKKGIYYTPSASGLLPSELGQVKFSRNIYYKN